VKAYIAELENQTQTALSNYDIIVNYENSPLLEDALNRIAVISIDQQNYSNVQLAMKCLAQLSPIYLPYFADAACLSQDMLTAINAYNQYINIFPEDIEAQLKLIKIYISHGIPEAANILLEHILKKDPNLKAALELKKKIKLVTA
jgi:tetratricopeptide (TPR) repeat protein